RYIDMLESMKINTSSPAQSPPTFGRCPRLGKSTRPPGARISTWTEVRPTTGEIAPRATPAAPPPRHLLRRGRQVAESQPFLARSGADNLSGEEDPDQG